MAIPKILTLSFTGGIPETAAELHQQIQNEIEPSTTLEEIQTQLNDLATEGFIQSAERKDDGATVYWRG